MTRIFEDTAGNEIPDIEFRLNYNAVVRALLANGTLSADDVETISEYRIRDVTEERAKAQALRETETRRLAEEEAKALKNRPQEVKAAAAEFTADPAADAE
jgi:ribosomal protein L19E